MLLVDVEPYRLTALTHHWYCWLRSYHHNIISSGLPPAVHECTSYITLEDNRSTMMILCTPLTYLWPEDLWSPSCSAVQVVYTLQYYLNWTTIIYRPLLLNCHWRGVSQILNGPVNFIFPLIIQPSSPINKHLIRASLSKPHTCQTVYPSVYPAIYICIYVLYDFL